MDSIEFTIERDDEEITLEVEFEVIGENRAPYYPTDAPEYREIVIVSIAPSITLTKAEWDKIDAHIADNLD